MLYITRSLEKKLRRSKLSLFQNDEYTDVPSPKVLKGSWTHYPDAKLVSHTIERLSGCSVLLQKVREHGYPFVGNILNCKHLQMCERLQEAYRYRLFELSEESHVIVSRYFSLAMQSGAFLQLILTFVAITSRLSTLVSELQENIRRACQLADRILGILHVSSLLLWMVLTSVLMLSVSLQWV